MASSAKKVNHNNLKYIEITQCHQSHFPGSLTNQKLFIKNLEKYYDNVDDSLAA